MNKHESRGSFSELNLTKTESVHAEKRATTSDLEKAKIEMFQQNPEAREMIVNNPFGENTKSWIEKLPKPENVYSVLRTAILAEPDGIYENEFNKSTKAEKKQKLYAQIDSSAEMTMKIEKYIEKNMADMDKMPEEILYKNLCQAAFDTLNEKEIQTKYALSQRRGFRLAIDNFLEDKNKLSKYRKEATDYPQAFAEKYLQKKFTGRVVIEQLPIGFVFYLDEADYALFNQDKKTPESITSHGLFISLPNPTDDLYGKIILINKGGTTSGLRKIDELKSTKKHETRHLIYQNFHQQFDLSTKIKLENFSEITKSDSEYFIEVAKNEIIAYFSQGILTKDKQSLGLESYKKIIDTMKQPLMLSPTINFDQKVKLVKQLDIYEKRTIETVNKIIFVAEKLYNQPNNNLMEKFLVKLNLKEDLTQKKSLAEALLRNTPGNKIHRLARYINLKEEDIKSLK